MHLDFSYKELDFIKILDNSIKIEFKQIWANKGHTLNTGLISPDRKHFFLSIPKNSSTFIKSSLLDLEWEHAESIEYPQATPIIILRDPVERWISGIFEYLLMYHITIIDNICEPYNNGFQPLYGEKLGLSLLFEKITFDDHSERQCVFLQNIDDLSKCIFLKLDKDFNQNLNALLLKLGYDININNSTAINSSQEKTMLGIKKTKFKDFMTALIKNDRYKEYNLQQWFWCDYELMSQVNFYAR